MTLQRISEHVQPTGTAEAAASSYHSPPRRFVPDFLENPIIDDNADLEIITKTSPAVAANMISGPSFDIDPEPSCQPIKMAPTKTRPRRPPHTILGVPARSIFQCSANHHASSHAHQTHVRCLATRPTTLACTNDHINSLFGRDGPPFCAARPYSSGAEICGVKGRGTSSFRGLTSLRSLRAGPPCRRTNASPAQRAPRREKKA